MQGLHKRVIFAVAMAWIASAPAGLHEEADARTWSSSPLPQGAVIAQQTSKRITFFSGSRLNSRPREIYAPGASFIKLHFSHFRLPEGIVVEISNPDRSETWRYSASERDPLTFDSSQGDDGDTSFSAMSITGDRALVHLAGDITLLKPGVHLLVIDSFQEGLPLNDFSSSGVEPNRSKGKGDSHIENACGSDQRYGATCWASEYPWEYARSAAAVKLITSRGEVCTAWRVGSDNHLFTAEHCLSNQSELDGAEIWFNYEAVSCGDSQTSNAVKVTGGSLLANDRDLDYSLFTVSNFSSISSFPAFGLDISASHIGQAIWIPQHGLGQPRQISLESDMNSNGVCEVDAVDLDGYAENSDLGYYCDTATSSSGSPVVDYETGRVIALHHFGGCLNSGVQISRIWPEVAGYFGGEVPNGNSGHSDPPGNQAPQAEISASCDELSCNFDATGSTDPDGTITTFLWALSDGGSSSAVSFDHGFSDEGSYEVTLTVEDNDGESSSVAQTVTVSSPNQPPVATITTSCIDTECQFNAGGSFDEDGTITSWYWLLGDGNHAAGEYIEHEYATDGSYSITLTVEDNEGAADSATRTVTLSAPNEFPTASFSYSCSELDCNFDAGGSSDPDGTITDWTWDFGDGGNGSGSHATHAYSESGSYSVTLSVRDNDGAEDINSRNVPVELDESNTSPIAAFNFSCTELDCTFDAGTSSDSDGSITTWSWNFGDGNHGNGSLVSHAYQDEGSYTITLSVEDNDGAGASVSKSTTVEIPNLSPQADFSFSCDISRCDFDGGSSEDTDGEIISWQWSFGDGHSASGPSVSHQFTSSASYQVILTVEDSDGASDVRTRMVTPEQSNSIPTASFSYQCDETSCRFDAGDSHDSYGDIVHYSWSMGDGNSASTETIEHMYGDSGSFSVTLTVENAQGYTDSRTRNVTVKDNPPEIVLSGDGSRHNGRALATLRWTGAEAFSLAVYRDNRLITVTPNDGKYIDTGIDSHIKAANYRLCQPSGDYCSNLLRLDFTP